MQDQTQEIEHSDADLDSNATGFYLSQEPLDDSEDAEFEELESEDETEVEELEEDETEDEETEECFSA